MSNTGILMSFQTIYPITMRSVNATNCDFLRRIQTTPAQWERSLKPVSTRRNFPQAKGHAMSGETKCWLEDLVVD